MKEDFFREGYLMLYPDVKKAGMDPCEHYVRFGQKEGRSNGMEPTKELFFSEGYALLYPDVEKSGIKPWIHYCTIGWKEGRSNGLRPPKNCFSADNYLSLYPDVKKSGMDPWRHYVMYGRKEGRSDGVHPSKNFFAEGYLALYPDVRKAGMDPWRHYALYGRKEKRSDGTVPPKSFFAEGYLALNPDVAKNGEDPWRHWVLKGKAEGRPDGSSAPDSFFPEGYLALYPDVKKAGMDPWRHYVLYGRKEKRTDGTVPPKSFFVEGYLALNPDVAESGEDPWRHWVLKGKAEGRPDGSSAPDSFFPEGYLALYPDVKKAGVDPWKHYVLYGKKEGRKKGIGVFLPKKSEAEEKKTKFRFLPRELQEKRPTILGYYEMLVDYDVISFDIFDTALLRKVAIPNNVFDIMSMEMHWPGFTDARKKAEELARKKNLIQYGHREVTLDEIYQFMKNDYGIDDIWEKREYELELQLSLPNPYIKAIYDKLVSDGKEIIFCSDMYLPEEFLHELLKKNGYEKYSRLYVSNAYGVRKGDGGLQQKVLVDYVHKRIIHVGDNKDSDYGKSIEVGLDAAWNPECRMDFTEGFMNNLSGSFFRAVISNTFNNGTYHQDKYYTHGFYVGGMLSAGYCQFINGIADTYDVEKILFCARDCFILNRIYKRFYQEYPSEYIQISRFAVMNLCPERYAEDLLERFVFRHWDLVKDSRTIAQVLEDMDYGYLVPYLDDNDLDCFMLCSGIHKNDFRRFFLDHIPVMVEHAKNQVQSAVQYFRQILGSAKRLLIVDIGWSGTCITALEYFLKRYIDKTIVVSGALLMSTYSRQSDNLGQVSYIHSYIGSSNLNVDLESKMFKVSKDSSDFQFRRTALEYLFTSLDSSLLAYQFSDEKGVEFRRSPNAIKNQDEILSMQEGMYEFNRILLGYTEGIGLKISPYTAFAPFLSMLRDNDYIIDIYRNFVYDEITVPNLDVAPQYFGERYEKKDKLLKEIEIQDKKIIFVSPELPYTGAVRSLLRVCKVALGQGYQPVVFSGKDGAFKSVFNEHGIPVFVVEPQQLEQSPYISMVKTSKMAYCNTIVTHAYAKVLSKYVPTIWFIREATNIPDFLRGNKERAEALQSFDNIYCVSEYAAQAISKFTTKPIHVIQNCVEDEVDMASGYITGSGDKVKFVQFGTMEYRKGYDVLLSAYKLMPQDYQDKSEVYFAGQFIKSNARFCTYLFTEMKDVKGVYYLGEIRGEQKKIDTLSRMDVVVVASRDESCSLVALEGSMLSKPIIVTENVGAKYMVKNGNGIVTEAGNAASLSKAMMQLIDKKDQLLIMGKQSRSNYEAFASMKKQTEDLSILFSDPVHATDRFRVIDSFVSNTDLTRITTQGLDSSIRPIQQVVGNLTVSKDPEVIVSMTSHPGRIDILHKCIASLLSQTYQNMQLILWLALPQFPDKKLPEKLNNLIGENFQVRWTVDDLKPHKKYFYACQEYPNKPIIIVDDDVLYDRNMVQVLVDSYKQHPDCVSCHRANLMTFNNKKQFRSYKKWILNYRIIQNIPSYQLMPTGVGGVLYPPGSIPHEALNKEEIKSLCLFQDDLWLKAWVSLKGYRTVVPEDAIEPKLIEGSQDVALWRQNIDQAQNDIALGKIVELLNKNSNDGEKFIEYVRRDYFC